MLKTVGEIIGYLAVALAIVIYTSRNRKTILIWKITSDALWVFSYLFIGAYSGAGVNVVNVIRDSLFSQKGKKKWLSSPFVAAAFILFNFISTFVLNYIGEGAILPHWYSILPPIGSGCAAIGLFCSDAHVVRLLNLPAISIWLVYSVLASSSSALVANILSLCSIGIGLWFDYRDRRKAKEAVPAAEKTTEENLQ